MVFPDFKTLNLEQAGDVLHVRMAQPEKLNSVSTLVLKDLVSLADCLMEATEIHYVIFGHEGKYFSAGADLSLIREMVDNPDAMRLHQNLAHEMMKKLTNLEQITFAAIEGSAYGAGVAITMTCDFRVMNEEAVLSLPETKRGMFLTYGSTPRLVQTVGLAKAKEMIMFAEDIKAQQCKEAGVVQDVVAKGEVLTTIMGKVEKLRTKDWRSIRIAKRVANAAVPPEFGNMVLTEPELVVGTIGPELEARLSDFLEKRA